MKDPLRKITVSKNGDYLVGIQQFHRDHIVKQSNKELEEKLKSVGAKVGSSVSKNTYLVVAKNKDDETGKVLEAKKLGVNVVSLEELHL